MTLLAIILCIVCQLFLVGGQIFLKHAMTGGTGPGAPRRHSIVWLIPGIACLTIWFFLWLGLLARWDLSRLFPFEGLNPALMVVGASFFLNERISAAAWVGIGLITAGIVLVA